MILTNERLAKRYAWDESLRPVSAQVYIWNGTRYEATTAPETDQPVMVRLK